VNREARGGEEANAAEYGKTASFLAIGVGLTGLITYAYFMIASHVLSKHDYGQITILWSAVFITISTLYRPVEQLLSRHISERLTKGEPLGQPMRVASTIQIGLALTFAVVALALRGPIWIVEATKPSTGSSSAPSSSTPPATSPAASSPASAASACSRR
jgi:O-antigen/teichoic acid export membrane protein